MKELPLEVVVEILSRLPIKPLIRFRCVSKVWLQLLTLDPQFAKLHYDRLIQTTKLNTNLGILGWPRDEGVPLRLALDRTSCHDVIPFHLPFYDSQSRFYDDDENNYRLFGICNGLLAIGRQYFRVHLCLHIWNPLTKDYINVDPPPTPDLQPSMAYGFGYDQSTDEYKVIGVHYYIDTKQGHVLRSQVNVFTLGVDSSWRIVEQDINLDIMDVLPTFSFLVNGVIHWIARRLDASSSHIIAGFDLRDEVFREIEPPSDMNLDDGRNFADVREMGGLLCIFSESPSFLEIWMMKEYGVFDSWTKLLKFDISETDMFVPLKPMGFAQNGDIILMFKRQTLYPCNPETKATSQNGDIILMFKRPTLCSCNPETKATSQDITLMFKRQTLCSCNPETKATRILAEFDDPFFNPYAYVGSIISPTVISRVGLSLEEEETCREKEKDTSKLNDQYINMKL